MKWIRRRQCGLSEAVSAPGRSRRWLLMAAAAATLCTSGPSAATTPVDVTRIEEDWIVEIIAPDPNSNAPQILTALSSTNLLADVHAVFELNHRTKPSYQPGGMQLQIWSGDVMLDHRPGSKQEVLSNENETITYTMVMRLSGGNLEFEVRNGESTSWGPFGRQGFLKASIGTDQKDLSLYNPDVSAANSAVTFARNRVKKFALTEVRYYSNQTLVATDTQERIVHQHAAQ